MFPSSTVPSTKRKAAMNTDPAERKRLYQANRAEARLNKKNREVCTIKRWVPSQYTLPTPPPSPPQALDRAKACRRQRAGELCIKSWIPGQHTLRTTPPSPPQANPPLPTQLGQRSIARPRDILVSGQRVPQLPLPSSTQPTYPSSANRLAYQEDSYNDAGMLSDNEEDWSSEPILSYEDSDCATSSPSLALHCVQASQEVPQPIASSSVQQMEGEQIGGLSLPEEREVPRLHVVPTPQEDGQEVVASERREEQQLPELQELQVQEQEAQEQEAQEQEAQEQEAQEQEECDTLTAQEEAIRVLNTMFTSFYCDHDKCQPAQPSEYEGKHTLNEVSESIELAIRVTDPDRPERGEFPAPLGFPLSNKKVQSARSSAWKLSKNIEWQKLLTGREILGAGQDPPELSLAKAERSSGRLREVARQEDGLEVWYDVDSVTFQALSLAVHKTSFKMFQAPNYLQTIRRDQKIDIPSLTTPLHKTKHIALGYGLYSHGGNFTTYLVFPHYPCVKAHGSQETVSHLDNKSLERLYNQAILPAMKEACSTHVTQHAPASWDDSYAKAHVRKEIGRGGNNATGIGLFSTVPEPDLDRLWTAIQKRCSVLQGPHENQDLVFRDPILIVQAHDTKLDSPRQTSKTEAFRQFNQRMQTMFHIDRLDYVNRRAYWVDFAREVITKEQGYTALGKYQCLESRLRKGLQQKGQPPNSVTKYPMAGLRDVGAITIKMHKKAKLYAGGLVDVKAYNINKEQLAVPVKNHVPFASHSLEGLGFTAERLQEWYRAGTGRNLNVEDQTTLARLVTMLESTKHRIWSAFSSSYSSSYGVREEYRITYELFEAYAKQLDLPTGPRQQAMPTRDTAALHLPFWILDTQELNRFRIADANRWLVCLESILEATTGYQPWKQSNTLVVDPDQHSPLASAMCRLLNASLGCHASDRSIWQGLPRKSRKRRQNKPPTPVKEGLNMKTIVQQYGMMWFPSYNAAGERLLDSLTAPPRIQPSVRGSLAIGDTAVQQLFKKKNIVLDPVSYLNTQLASIDLYIDEVAQQEDVQARATRYNIYRAAAEVCVQAYSKWMWKILRERWEEHTRLTSNDPALQMAYSDFEDFVLGHGGSNELLRGHVGFGYGQICSVFATVATLRVVPVQPASKKSRFKTHTRGTWEERIRTLFYPEEGQFARTTLPFVELATHCETVLRRGLQRYKFAGGCVDEWRDYLPRYASKLMLTVLRYDFAKPAALQDAKGDMLARTSLERTGLYAAAADPYRCDIHKHNAWLRRAAKREAFGDALQEERHRSFLQQLYQYTDLPVLQISGTQPRRGKKRSHDVRPPPPGLQEEDVPYAHGLRLKFAVHLEESSRVMFNIPVATELEELLEEEESQSEEEGEE